MSYEPSVGLYVNHILWISECPLYWLLLTLVCRILNTLLVSVLTFLLSAPDIFEIFPYLFSTRGNAYNLQGLLWVFYKALLSQFPSVTGYNHAGY